MKSNVSFWLVPSEPDRKHLEALIDNLAEKYGAPHFMPHVTIYAGEYTGSASPQHLMQTALDIATQSSEAVTLQIAGMSYSAEFTKTLFIQFEPSQILHQMCEVFRRRSEQPSDYSLNPHLSLIYHPLDETTQQQLATSIQLPHPVMTFNQVAAIAYTPPVLTKADVESWRVISTQTILSKTLPPRTTEP